MCSLTNSEEMGGALASDSIINIGNESQKTFSNSNNKCYSYSCNLSLRFAYVLTQSLSIYTLVQLAWLQAGSPTVNYEIIVMTSLMDKPGLVENSENCVF